MTLAVRTDPTTVEVSLGTRSYDIVIGRGLLASLGTRIAALRPGAKAVIVTDDNVARCHLAPTEAALARAIDGHDVVVSAAGNAADGAAFAALFHHIFTIARATLPPPHRIWMVASTAALTRSSAHRRKRATGEDDLTTACRRSSASLRP